MLNKFKTAKELGKMITLLESFVIKKISGKKFEITFLKLRRDNEALWSVSDRINYFLDQIFHDIDVYVPNKQLLAYFKENPNSHEESIDEGELRKRVLKNLNSIKKILRGIEAKVK